MEALLYEKIDNNKVKCNVCNHYCIINNGKRGICSVRENIEGTLHTLNYGLSIATSIDPIEKKPLYYFLPKTDTYSFASVGCNMNCPWCQNHTISQSPKLNNEINGTYVSPETHVSYALKYNCPSISYTYTEPTIFLEYALAVMKLAKENNIKNIWVTNGFMSKETIELILPYIDALNIDYKGDDNVYKKYCLGNSHNVLENLKTFKDNNIHIEVTTLLIPGVNTDNFNKMASELKRYVGNDIPWHISRFFPSYKMTATSVTPRDIMYEAYQIAKDLGFKYVELGNM